MSNIDRPSASRALALVLLTLAAGACASGGAFDSSSHPNGSSGVAAATKPPKEEFTGNLPAFTRVYDFRTDAKQAFAEVKRSGRPAMVYYVDPA